MYTWRYQSYFSVKIYSLAQFSYTSLFTKFNSWYILETPCWLLSSLGKNLRDIWHLEVNMYSFVWFVSRQLPTKLNTVHFKFTDSILEPEIGLIMGINGTQTVENVSQIIFLAKGKGVKEWPIWRAFSSQSSQKGNVRHKKINVLKEGDSALSKSVALNSTIGVQVELFLFCFSLVWFLVWVCCCCVFYKQTF